MQEDDATRHVVLSGCSGGGKSALLEELQRRGFATVAEPGRRIVESELRRGGTALPWTDLQAFALRAIGLAGEDRRRAKALRGWVFFDRGLVDAAVALQHAVGRPAAHTLDGTDRYHRLVFLVPPWPEIYAATAERRHGLDAAVAEFDRLLAAYGDLGYQTLLLPKVDVAARADFLLHRLLGGRI